MEKLQLIAPSLAYATELLDYKTAFSGEHIYSDARLEEIENWLEHLSRSFSYDTCEEGHSPSSTFLCLRESDKK